MAKLAPDFMQRLSETFGDPSAFSELVFGTPFHEGQARYTKEANGQVNFLLPGNSWGKTEFLARYAVYCAWFKVSPACPPFEEEHFEDWLHFKWQGLIASYTYDVAEESLNRLRRYYRDRPEFAALVAKIPLSEGEITLTNGSELFWGSVDGKGKLVEARRLNVIFVDEVGHIPDLAYTYDNILYPRTMGVSGVIHFLGTPKEYSDPFLMEIYERGKNGGDGYYFSQSGSVLENQFWPEAERARVLQNPRYVIGWQECDDEDCTEQLCDPVKGHPVLTPVGRQVILGAFVLEGSLFFNRFAVARIFSEPGPEPDWVGGDHFNIGPQRGHLYAGAFDLAGNKLKKMGKRRGSDPTVGFVVDHTVKPWRIVRYDYIRGGDADWEAKYQLMEEVYRSYDLQYLLIDATGNVDSVQEALQNRGIEVEGVMFSGSSNKKLDMLRNLQLTMEWEWTPGQRGVLRSPLIPKLKYELEHYLLPDEHIQQDTVMALAMVCWYIAQNDIPAAVGGEVW